MAAKKTPEVPNATLDVCDPSCLNEILHSANEHDERCSHMMDSTNVFAVSYRALGQAAQRLLDLFAERGHNGGQ